MKYSRLIPIVFLFFGLILIFYPKPLNAVEMDSSLPIRDQGRIVEIPKKMTQKQMNDLLGEDPYLGQTSYLQSPDGFSQREK